MLKLNLTYDGQKMFRSEDMKMFLWGKGQWKI